MSQLNSADRGVVVPKAKPNIYTALLAISLVAIITGIVLLSMELGRYNWKLKPTPQDLTPSQVMAPAWTASTPIV